MSRDREHNVIVVGARCAGSPLALQLARAGLDVCLVDQARFPSDTLSTHVIKPQGVALLDGMGVLGTLRSRGAVEIEHFSLINDDVRIDGSIEPDDYPGLCARRVTLDNVLVHAAEAAGARVRTQTRVLALIRDKAGRVAGVETGDGPIRARLVVGADGMNSTVAKLVNAREHHVVPGGRMFAVGHMEGVTDTEGHLRIGRVSDNAFIAAPTDGGLFMAGVGISMSESAAFRADRERCYAKGLHVWPELGELVAGSTRVGPIRLITEWHGFFRDSSGPGWALVGDAGHFKDFTPGQGISDALRQVDHLAPAIVRGLNGDDLDAELKRWCAWRDADAWDMYWFAADLGSAGGSTPLETRVLRNLSARPDGASRVLDVFDHRVPPSDVFTTRSLLLASLQTLFDRSSSTWPTMREIARNARAMIQRERARPAMPDPSARLVAPAVTAAVPGA